MEVQMDEKVLVVPAAEIEEWLRTSFDPAAARAVIERANASPEFRPRNEVEEDESWKQIIPYVCIRHGDSYVLLQRTNKQREARLHNKFSLGIGGHINEIEAAGGGADLVHSGLLRELEEEIRVAEGWKLNLLGTIYDGGTAVGRVHFGIVHELETDLREFTLNEADLMSGEWVRAAELGVYRERMETWSQLLFDHHIAREGVAAPGRG